MAATLRKIGKQAIESPTNADKNMPLPLAQKMGRIFSGCSGKQVRTGLVEGFSNTHGFEMARKQSDVNWLVRVLYCMLYYDGSFQNQPDVMAFLEARD